jgi:hypothetical protein
MVVVAIATPTIQRLFPAEQLAGGSTTKSHV